MTASKAGIARRASVLRRSLVVICSVSGRSISVSSPAVHKLIAERIQF